MSIFHPAVVTCAKCGTEARAERNASVNVDRRPELREEILDGRFQATPCGKCGTRLRLPPHFIYLDVGRNLWLAAEPADMLEDWPEVEEEVEKVYARAFGDLAPPAARELGSTMRARLAFGWAAVREKLLCDDLGLDDVTLELLKIAIMREVNDAPMADQTELRLVGGNAEALEFAWVVTATEEYLNGLTVPRAAYDDIVAQAEDWEPVRENFQGVKLVDLRRLIAGRETDAATG